jgi:hypothetical protein
MALRAAVIFITAILLQGLSVRVVNPAKASLVIFAKDCVVNDPTKKPQMYLSPLCQTSDRFVHFPSAIETAHFAMRYWPRFAFSSVEDSMQGIKSAGS